MAMNNERQQRIKLENQMINLKDEALKRDMLANELDFRCQNLEQANEDLQQKYQHVQMDFQNQNAQNKAMIHDLQVELDRNNNILVTERQQKVQELAKQEQRTPPI